MRNLFLISFVLLFVGCSDDSNPITSSCSDGGCTTEQCASDCSCGCDGAGGDDCTCSTECVCGTTCGTGGCSASGCASDCPCGCDGAGGDDCTCSTECQCSDSGGGDGGDDPVVDCLDTEVWTNVTTHAISISNFSFTENSLDIEQCDIVIWTNNASSNHTVTSDSPSTELDSGTLAGSDTYEHQFDSAEEFTYHCNFHGSMTGIITVTE